MNVLVLQAHPSAESFNRAVCATAVDALAAGGHEVRTVHLYDERFVAAMSGAERVAYHSDTPILDDAVARHADHVRWAEALVFVYPTWWGGLPAVLKGWLERVLVPGVAFHIDPVTHKVVPDLQHIRRVVGVSTYGTPRPYVWLLADPGRRTLTRALRMSCSWRTRRTWLGLYGIDASTAADRAAFLRRVDAEAAPAVSARRVLVVYAHPVTDSFVAAARDRAVKALERAGHDVDLLDLYAEDFDPRLSESEWTHTASDRRRAPPRGPPRTGCGGPRCWCSSIPRGSAASPPC